MAILPGDPSKPGVPSTLSSLREATLEAYLEEYKKLNETWRSIETKAQGSIAVSGIFIAGALAFITTTGLILRCHEKILLFIGLSCLNHKRHSSYHYFPHGFHYLRTARWLPC